MKIIIAPARRMTIDTDSLPFQDLPRFLPQTKKIFEYMRSLSYDQCHWLWWNCSEKLARKNYRWLHQLDLTSQLTPAILAFTGLQYQYMLPDVFTDHAFDYVQNHLRILSGFYGLLRPLDGIVPYRLGMGDRAKVAGTKNLYQFWGSQLADALYDQPDQWVLNLASKEYSKAITPYLTTANGQHRRMVTVIFGQIKADGKVRQTTTRAKMARGRMVRYLAENDFTSVEAVKAFHDDGFAFDQSRSSNDQLVFIQHKN